MFKNMDDCHFTAVYHDIHSYCTGEPEEEEEDNSEYDEWAKYDFDTTLDEHPRCTFASV